MSDALTDINRENYLDESWEKITKLESILFNEPSKETAEKLIERYEDHKKLRKGYFGSPNVNYANEAIDNIQSYLDGEKKYEELKKFLEVKYPQEDKGSWEYR
jgi:hypothetical protein